MLSSDHFGQIRVSLGTSKVVWCAPPPGASVVPGAPLGTKTEVGGTGRPIGSFEGRYIDLILNLINVARLCHIANVCRDRSCMMRVQAGGEFAKLFWGAGSGYRLRSRVVKMNIYKSFARAADSCHHFPGPHFLKVLTPGLHFIIIK